MMEAAGAEEKGNVMVIATDDVEAGTSLEEENQTIWTSHNDPRRPIHWPRAKKWTATLILSCFSFLQPLSETMIAPAEQQISRGLHITQSYDWLLVNSLILVGVGLAPLLQAPLSEVYGRKPILIVASIIFTIWNTACGASTTLGQILAFRLLSGFGASVADALAGGLMSDLWPAEERGRAFAIYMAAPLLGPALGPILGAFVSEGVGWRWVFWITSIASAAVIVIAVVFLRETYEPKVEQQLLSQQRRGGGEKGSSKGAAAGVIATITTMFSPPDNTTTTTTTTNNVNDSNANTKETFLTLMKTNLQRPLRMLATQVIIQLLAAYMALLYGTMFLFLFMYPLLWTTRYSQPIGLASLNYISFAIGLIIGVNIAGHVNDHIYAVLVKRHSSNNNNTTNGTTTTTTTAGAGKPEFRIPPMILGTALVPTGLLLWGWTGEAKVHWIVPNLGSLVFGAGVYVCSGCVSVYTIDAYGRYAASAVSTNLVARSLAAAFFPLFAPYLFDALGFGLGATVLAAAFALLGAVVVFVLWFFGERLRERSPYCAAAAAAAAGSDK